MKAALNRKYGGPDVVRIEEVEKPVAGKDEVLIKIHAAGINSADSRMRSLNVPKGFGIIVRLVFGIFAPRNKILGMEFSGTIESIGSDVSKFKVGDAVFAGCMFGAHAEYRVIKQDVAIVLKPKDLSFEEAGAMSFGGSTALNFLKIDGNIKTGERVLINGASGAVGIAAVQLAKYFGADVTAVCSAANAELVTSMGADRVIDYASTDFAKTGETFDIIMDNVGNAPWGRVKNSLKPTGRLLMVVGGMPEMLQGAFVSKKNGKRVISGTSGDNAVDLQFLAELAEAGKFKPFIEKTYRLEDIVAAHRHVDSGRKRGSIVIVMDN
ncbi:MAG: NAD(P)-dependent alcohol dehydrogenase [Devosiaceae bacterium]|nr:NAD(P)-dependent alcohol dehydrogenase [Devosiaceae bacterium]